jgi:transcriptional regulator GlxA family with amidase domain
MREITYATKTFVTTDAIASALVRLVTSIRRDTQSEAVTVPAYTSDGRRVEATMTLDASSELVAVPSSVDADDSQENDEAVQAALQDIDQRIRHMAGVGRAVYPDEPDLSQYNDEY